MGLPNVHGTARLLTDPRRTVTGAGKPMASALLKFHGWRKDDAGKWVEGDAVIADAVAFEDAARALAEFAKGDDVEVVDGVVTGIDQWQGKTRLKVRIKECAVPRPRQEPVRREVPQQRRGRTQGGNGRQHDAVQRLHRAHGHLRAVPSRR